MKVNEVMDRLQKEFPEAKVQKLGDGIYVKITKDEDYSEALETIDREFGNLHFQAGKYISGELFWDCLLYTSPSPRDGLLSRMPSSA